VSRMLAAPGKRAGRLIIASLLCLSAHVAIAQQTLPDASAPQNERDVRQLSVSIAVFDPGIPEDESTHRRLEVFPRIRQIESLFLPFVLRETLLQTRQWGAVRVVPEPDIAAELLVSGTILRSDGENLILHLHVVDSSGRIWIDKPYSGIDTMSRGRDSANSGMSGYQDLYDRIAADMRSARDNLDEKSLQNIVEISLLRYAGHLVPSVFADYLRSEPDGAFRINRLPAENDPIIERIERIRNVEYVLTDAVDTKFEELHAEIAFTYDLWRKYRREYAQYQRDEAAYSLTSTSNDPPGSYESLKKRYDNYKWTRLGKQEQEAWAEGFNNEVGPTVEAVESRVAELEGWVDQHYAEWDRMLSELFLLESDVE
jgi:hypothetical protein